MQNAVPCFRCGQVLDYAFSRPVGAPPHNQPADGCVFRSYGNYGSTVFDPYRESAWLEIAICDACLLACREHLVFSPGVSPLDFG